MREGVISVKEKMAMCKGNVVPAALYGCEVMALNIMLRKRYSTGFEVP